MSTDQERAEFHRRTLPDILDWAAYVGYIGGALMFVGGVWIDWHNPGQVVLDFLVIANDPHANSGLFIGGMLLMTLGFFASRISSGIENYRSEEIEDETQEWVVDVGN